MKRLIVSADDFGLHPGINEGVLRAHRDGIVTSASLCATGVAFEDAVARARVSPELDVGVHLTLVGECALSSPPLVPTLAPEGRLPSSFIVLFRRLLLRRVRAEEIERELEAQLARVRDAGITITHVDSHQHVHLHPFILPIALRAAARFGVTRVRAARRLLPRWGARACALGLFASRASRRTRAQGWRCPDSLMGVSESGRLSAERLDILLNALPDGTTELISHPGSGGASIGQTYEWNFRWDEEAAALTREGLRERLQRGGVMLCSYRDL